MFILNPDPYSLPCYHIGPFETKDLSKNHSLPENNNIDNYLNERFRQRQFIYTENGRKAMNLALSHYGLVKDDVVTILTTSGNFYISGCVTKEIEKFCGWSRMIEEKTKVIFVNHEFGYPYPDLKGLKEKYNLPVIEDCANTLLSVDPNGDIGNVGDFVIYSFPKIFPIQVGGLLLSNLKEPFQFDYEMQSEIKQYTKNVLSYYFDSISDIIKKRINNYLYLKERFEKIGFYERFRLENGVVPSVFMFKTEGHDIDLPKLKEYYYSHGVQCSVFYGEEGFFIPVHQALTKFDLDYFYEIIKSFLFRFNL